MFSIPTISGGISSAITPCITTSNYNSIVYTTPFVSGKGVYEFIIYTFDEDDNFELLDEGKLYANNVEEAKQLALFDFAKNDDEYGFEDLVVEVRLF